MFYRRQYARSPGSEGLPGDLAYRSTGGCSNPGSV